MKATIKFLAVFCAIIWAQASAAQDARFTQLTNHPMQLNPSLISSSNDFRVTLGHRAQWESIDKGYVTESFSMVHPVFLKKDSWKEDRGNAKLDIGLSVINERAGAFNTFNPQLTVSSALKISQAQYLSLALYGGYFYTMLDVGSLTFDEQYIYGSWLGGATGESMVNEVAGAPDAGFGMSWYYVPNDEDARFNAYAGFSGFHMNEFSMSFLDRTGKIHSKLSVQSGFKVRTDALMDIESHLGYISQGANEHLYMALLAGFNIPESGRLVFGAWYKTRESMALQLGWHHRSYFFDMSYDFLHTDINRSVSYLNTWEVTAGYKFNRAAKRNYVNSSFF